MNPPPQVIRRLVLTPVAWAGALLLSAVALLLMPLALVLDLVDRRSWRHMRLLSLGAAFCALEFAALSAGFGVWVAHIFDRDQASRSDAFQAVLAWWLRSITTSIRRCLNFTFDVRFPDTGDAPLIVLSRHAGPGDALFLMNELANVQHRQIRAIGKGKLLWDPFFEQVAGRAGYLFLHAGDDDPIGKVRANSAMPPRGAFISFPEGGNFTRTRHGLAVEGLRHAGKTELAETATGLRHLLLPRPRGVHAALLGAPDATVVFVGHSGYDDLDSLAGLWRGIPERRRVRLEARVVPRPPEWRDHDVVAQWLLQCWGDMDRWIRKHSKTDAR